MLALRTGEQALQPLPPWRFYVKACPNGMRCRLVVPRRVTQMTLRRPSCRLIIAILALALVPDEVVASAAPLHRTGAASSSPQLSVRFPGQGRACRFNAILSRNNGRPTDVTCLVEGNGFIPYRPVHLTYDVSIPMLPVAPTDQSARVANRPVLTPLPHVRCLMRLPRSCRVIVPNAHGHFGPVWMRFIYLLGERNQYFEIRAYGGPHDQATFTLPYQIVNE